jgi:hypothetical protein
MLKRLLVLIIIGIIATTSISGCQQLGKWTGEGAEEVEEGAEEFEEGYEEGKD